MKRWRVVLTRRHACVLTASPACAGQYLLYPYGDNELCTGLIILSADGDGVVQVIRERLTERESLEREEEDEGVRGRE